MIDSEALKEILSYTIKAFNNSLLVEERNAQLKNQIKNFNNTLIKTQMDLDLCRSKINELNEKKAMIQNKREQLAEIQRNIIQKLDNDSIITDLSNNPLDYTGVPPVLMFILETLYSATEAQLSSGQIKIPISQILEISESINEMHNKLVNSNIINETDDETKDRNENIAQNQQIFMNELIGSINTDNYFDENFDENDNDAISTDNVDDNIINNNENRENNGIDK